MEEARGFPEMIDVRCGYDAPAMSTAASAPSPTATAPVVIVGAGPAGLAAAACLKHRGVKALVLEAGPSVGSAWRSHYDRLHLHTVKEQSHLPGLPFGKELPRYPSRDEVVAYLEAYAARFADRAAHG